MERPLITFFLFSYKQERFIRAAVEGAFAQTYSPLEIILSDDCSPDSTFEIMRGMAAAYKGPHRIILNRNPRNFGIASHVNHIVNLSHGEMLVVSAGDDISLPHRTEETVRAWRSESPRPLSLFANAIVIDEKGEEQGLMFEAGWQDTHNQKAVPITLKGHAWVIGATHAFSRRLFTQFGLIDQSVVQEDSVIPFRALLLGRIKYVDMPLAYYRRHSQNIFDIQSNQVAAHSARKHLENRIACARQNLRDLRTARSAGLVTASVYWHQYFVVSYMCKLERIRGLSEKDRSQSRKQLRSFELKLMYLGLRILRPLEEWCLNCFCSDKKS